MKTLTQQLTAKKFLVRSGRFSRQVAGHETMCVEMVLNPDTGLLRVMCEGSKLAEFPVADERAALVKLIAATYESTMDYAGEALTKALAATGKRNR